MQQTSALSESEMQFRRKRSRITMEHLQDILGHRAPTTVEETPTIALVISGGGYRAVSTSCGATEALMENGLFDALMYCVGLSGSVWYMSSTYSRKSFSDIKTLTEDHDWIRDRLGEEIEFGPLTALKYVFKSIFTTREISLADVFGSALRDVLLPRKHKNATLSSLREYVETAAVPLPIFSAASVRNKSPVIDFWEEVEFSPFEATYASYRLLVPIEHVDSVWENGILSEVKNEPKLHYIMGFCGSAFAILLLHVTDGHEKKKRMFLYLLDDLLQGIWKAATGDIIPDLPFSPKIDMPSEFSDKHFGRELVNIPPAVLMSEEEFEKEIWNKLLEKDSSDEGEDVMTLDEAYELYCKYMDSEDWKWIDHIITDLKKESTVGATEQPLCRLEDRQPVFRDAAAPDDDRTEKFVGRSRNIGPARRTGFLRNPIYGMPNPIEKYMMNDRPIRERDPDALKRIGEKLSTNEREILVVDSGLGCNVPAIHVARPQRKVDVMIVVDCETKATDINSKNYMGTLKDLQRQMDDNNMKFPPIDIEKLKQDPEKEYYLFEDTEDPDCPVVIWFTLYNVRFRNLLNAPRSDQYSPPDPNGERFNDFDVTPDRKEYGTTNLKYSARDVDRLRELMKFNISANIEVIKEKIAQKVVALRSKTS